MKINEIGTVKNEFDEPKDPEAMRDSQSVIEIFPEYGAGLREIETNSFIQVLFFFHLSEGYELISPRRHGEERGVFASRSPHRPSSIGATVVELIDRDGNRLTVRGLDAVHGTPVVDIKPYADPFDSASLTEEERKKEPRRVINNLVDRGDTEGLLLEAGALHGHFCPFLALGVVAAEYAVSELGEVAPDMEETVALVETNSCFSDGIQYVTGCTFGNNALVYKDFGKTAVTVASRDGPGIRLYLSKENLLEEDYPEGKELFRKVVREREGTDEEKRRLREIWADIGFDLVTRSAEELFRIEKIRSPEIPDFAPIYEDGFCADCGEKFMAPKGVAGKGRELCLDCSHEDYLQLDGSGLRKREG